MSESAEYDLTGPGERPDPDHRSPARALAQLVAVVVAASAVLVLLGAGDVLVFAAFVVAMVMLHELGHLLAAKRGGMKVTEYFLGFGSRFRRLSRNAATATSLAAFSHAGARSPARPAA